jgi:hypothetical protein
MHVKTGLYGQNQEAKIMDYGKQAQDFLTTTGTKITMTKLPGQYQHFESDKKDNVWRDVWEVTIQRDDKKISLKFGQSLMESKTHTKPTKYDVLACLTKYDPGSFKDFCGDYGYSADSIALKMYKAVKDEYKKVCYIWSEMEIALLGEIK